MKSQIFIICFLTAMMMGWGDPGNWAQVYWEAGLNTGTPHNSLTPSEVEKGWELLFDGSTLNSPWRAYQGLKVPSGWMVKDESIHRAAGGGDIIYEKKYSDFVLALEWKVSHGANSGIFIRGNEKTPKMYQNAIEMQVLDNDNHLDGRESEHMAGAIYDVYTVSHEGVDGYDPTFKLNGEPTDYNKVLIVVSGNHHEFWLNGIKTAEFEWNSGDWNKKVEDSKFGGSTLFGKDSSGYIGLQDHSHQIWFRNIKIRPLPTHASQSEIWLNSGLKIKKKSDWVFHSTIPIVQTPLFNLKGQLIINPFSFRQLLLEKQTD